MKTLKLLFTAFLFTVMSQTSFAQDKLETKADALVKEMSDKLATSDFKVSDEQAKLLKVVYLKKVTQIKDTKKEITDETAQKEKIKELNKAISKEIFDTILTKDQKAFLKSLKKNQDNKEN